MKKIYTLALFSLGLFLGAQAQVTNGDFESWTTLPGYVQPEVSPSLFTSTDSEFSSNSEFNSVTEVAGTEGSAMRMETYELNEDTIGGFAIFGDVPNGDDLIFSGGFPFSDMSPTGISLDMRYDITPDSPGFILIQFLFEGAPVAGAMDGNGTYFFTFSGEQLMYDNFTFDFSLFPLTETPDECVIAMSCNDVIDGSGIPGDWLEVDNILINGSTSSVPGGDFNTWNTIDGPTVVDDWQSIYPPGLGFVTQSEDSYEGSFAARMETLEFDEEILQSMIFLGEANDDGIFPNQPVENGSLGLSFQYQFAAQDSEEGIAYLITSDVENPSPIDFQYEIRPLPATEGWEEVVFDFSEMGITPVLYSIIFMSGPGFDEEGTLGSVLDLDAFGFFGLGDCEYEPTINEGDLVLCPGETLTLTTQVYDDYSWYAAEQDGEEFFDFSEGENTIVEEDAESGFYEIFVQTVLDGCVANSDTILLEVIDIPSPELIGETEVCVGQSIDFSVDNSSDFDTFQWVVAGFDVPLGGNDADFEFTGILDGELEIYVETTSSGVCPDSVLESETITVTTYANPEPTIDLDVNTLSTQMFQAYQWYLNGEEIEGANGAIYDPEVDGQYFVLVTNENGCVGESEPFNFVIDGISELQNTVTIYPNPTTSFIEISGFSNGILEVYNSIGVKVLEKVVISATVTQMDLSDLPSGTYLVKGFTENKLFSKVILKK